MGRGEEREPGRGGGGVASPGADNPGPDKALPSLGVPWMYLCRVWSGSLWEKKAWVVTSDDEWPCQLHVWKRCRVAILATSRPGHGHGMARGQALFRRGLARAKLALMGCHPALGLFMCL